MDLSELSVESSGYAEIVRIMAPLIDDNNAPDENGWTPIYRAAYNGNTEVIKILAPLINNPNAPNKKEGLQFIVHHALDILKLSKS